MQQYQQEAAGTATAATSNARPSSARQTSSSGMQLNLTKQVPADQGISSLVDSAAVAASPFVLLPSTLHPLSVTPALSYFGSTTSASSSASTPLPLHPSLGRPVVYASQELTINDAVGLEAITVRNYYVEAITVKQMVAIPVRGDREGRSKQVWRTILNRHPLMQRPHEEGEAQRMVTLHTSLFHAEKYQPENLYRLRFDLECSSPAWKTFYLQDVQCWRKRTEGAAEGETTARGRSARPASAKALRPAGTGAAAKSNAPSSAEDLLAQFSSAPYAASSSLLATKLASPSVRQRIDEIASSLQIIGE